MTSKIADEVLMAYADGELDRDLVDQVEAHLATDPEARRLVERYRRTSRLSAEAFAQPVYEAPPSELVEYIRRHARSSRRVVSLPARMAKHWVSLPVAATIALVIGTTIGALVMPTGGQYGHTDGIILGEIPRSARLSKILETLPSGRFHPIEDHLTATVIGTFQDGARRFCREFEILKGPSENNLAPEAAAIACRTPEGGWRIEGAAHVASAQQEQSGYVPSGATEQDALDGLVKILGLGQALPPDAEANLLRNSWMKKTGQ